MIGTSGTSPDKYAIYTGVLDMGSTLNHNLNKFTHNCMVHYGQVCTFDYIAASKCCITGLPLEAWLTHFIDARISDVSRKCI